MFISSFLWESLSKGSRRACWDPQQQEWGNGFEYLRVMAENGKERGKLGWNDVFHHCAPVKTSSMWYLENNPGFFILKLAPKRFVWNTSGEKWRWKGGLIIFFWLFLHPVVQIWPLSECLVTQQLWGVGSFLFPHLQDCRKLCCLCYPVELHNTCFLMQGGGENRQAFRHWFKTFLGIFTTYEVDLRYSDPFLIL